MSQLSAITKQKHSNKSWTRFSTYHFASKDNLVPLAGAEIAKAVSALPMGYPSQVFTQRPGW